jgi:ABC-type branched-subunit amino acid transport system substrate-binding protein
MQLKKVTAAMILAGLAASAYAQEVVVKIGHTGPLSGSQAFAGKDNENGARLAVEELNAKPVTIGGKKVKFELVSEDDQADPKQGVSAGQKFADAGVKYIVGPYNSGVTIPASRVYHDAGTLIATVATNPKVTESGYKNVFRVVASDSQIGSKMALYAAKELKLKTVAVIDDRTAFGQGVAEEFKKQAKQLGLNVVGHEFTNDKASDFTSILTNLKAKKPEAIFYGGYAPQAAPMARQMKLLGLNAKMLGGDTLCSPEMGQLGGDAVGENVLCAQGAAQIDKAPAGPEFKAKYKKRYSQEPDVYAATFYDAVNMYVNAMKAANTTDAAKVEEQLHKGSYKGVVTSYAFDDRGNLKQSPVTVYTFKGGQPVPIASY